MATTVTTHQSWFSRIGSSIKNVLTGISFIIFAIFLIFWNEKRAIQTYESLNEGAKSVQPASIQTIDPSLEGKLIHISGAASTPVVLGDTEFGFSQQALRMRRIVEVFQWQESKTSSTKENVGGSTDTTTTYRYNKEWSEELIDSSAFHESNVYVNPASKIYESKGWTASNVTVGVYTIPPAMIENLSGFQELPLQDQLNTLPYEMQQQSKLSDNILYINGANPANPQVGDTRIRYEYIPVGSISAVAQQQGPTLAPYTTKNGRSISLISAGQVSAEQMFQDAIEGNNLLTNGLRIVAFVLILLGFLMILGPLSVLASVIPLFGDIIGMGTFIVALILTLITSLTAFSLAWITARPVLSIVLLLVSIISFITLILVRKGKSAQQKTSDETPPQTQEAAATQAPITVVQQTSVQPTQPTQPVQVVQPVAVQAPIQITTPTIQVPEQVIEQPTPSTLSNPTESSVESTKI